NYGAFGHIAWKCKYEYQAIGRIRNCVQKTYRRRPKRIFYCRKRSAEMGYENCYYAYTKRAGSGNRNYERYYHSNGTGPNGPSERIASNSERDSNVDQPVGNDLK